MPRNSRSIVTRRAVSRRATEWNICSSPTGFSVGAAGAKTIAVLIPSSTLADIAPATVVRTRCTLSIQSDQTGVSENQVGAFGIGFVNDVAGALGITALPGPAADCGWPGWFVHQWFNQSWLFISGVGVQNRSVSYEIDSKAMRKFESEQAMVAIVENFGTTGLQFAVSFRILTKAG